MSLSVFSHHPHHHGKGSDLSEGFSKFWGKEVCPLTLLFNTTFSNSPIQSCDVVPITNEWINRLGAVNHNNINITKSLLCHQNQPWRRSFLQIGWYLWGQDWFCLEWQVGLEHLSEDRACMWLEWWYLTSVTFIVTFRVLHHSWYDCRWSGWFQAD